MVVALGLVVGCTSSDDVTRESCTRLRDHVVDLRVGAYDHMTDPNGRAIDMAPHREALRHVLGDRFVGTCVASMSGGQVRCALKAKTPAAVQGCAAHAH